MTDDGSGNISPNPAHRPRVQSPTAEFPPNALRMSLLNSPPSELVGCVP
ncbi:hypothetical protein M5D96_003747 [Drosophila gunungcola]|uniref:Uncharacterized protein n=1 Tax=Drosophila gunungcola TaxID=103775 RepID=A0A9P9YTK9_9MUSC|nr:hypothetical protein M5D96_003747 [Drosophila gunungcola]